MIRQSRLFAPTLRDIPNDAEAKSHQLMLRAGYIRQVAAGIYAYLPLAHRVMANIQAIIREEMEAIEAIEMDLPTLIPADLWQETGRYDTYGPELVKLQDRHQRDFILGPTHEETFTDLIRRDIDSYKKLPLTLYQLQSKYRDEKRPRFGLLRGREFLMKDAYSFHISDESLDDTYEQMKQAYSRIFDRVGLTYKAIIGDAGAMGGRDSTEFMALSASGEDTVVYSDGSDYAANLEMAQSLVPNHPTTEVRLEKTEISTPNVKTIKEVADYLAIDVTQLLKSLLFLADEERLVCVVLRGDHEVNEVKVKQHLNAKTLRLATDSEMTTLFGTVPGFVGPVKLPDNVEVLADRYVKYSVNAVIGANKADTHLQNVQPDRDFDAFEYADVRLVEEGETSPDGEGKLVFERGIEIGHIFKLGTFYSDSMKATVLDDTGRPKSIIMGSYGIGVSRLLSAIVEQHYDEKGIIWPKTVAPFDVHLVPINYSDPAQKNLTDDINTLIAQTGRSVLVDDRNERAGVKFSDAELMGMPVQITIGRKASEGIVELTLRQSGETLEVKKDEILNTIDILK